jgi:hypothetical protein
MEKSKININVKGTILILLLYAIVFPAVAQTSPKTTSLKLKIKIDSNYLEVADADFTIKMPQDRAVNACNALGNGWRLPNARELEAMYEQLFVFGKGGFKKDKYWSSLSHYDFDRLEVERVGSISTLHF